MKQILTAIVCSLLLAVSSAGAGETLEKAKKTGKEIGSAFKEVATEIGHSVRDVALDVADGAAEAGRSIKKELSDNNKKAKQKERE